MTEREAIHEFNVMIGNRMRTNQGISENQLELFNMAIEALEKQVPKKPREGSFGVMGCPFCLEKVGQRVTKTLYQDLLQYCPTCGQKISWEDIISYQPKGE